MKRFYFCFLILLGCFAFLPSCGNGGEDKNKEAPEEKVEKTAEGNTDVKTKVKAKDYAWLEGTWKQDDGLAVLIENKRFKYATQSYDPELSGWISAMTNLQSSEWRPLELANREIDALEETHLTLSEAVDGATFFIVNDKEKRLEFCSGLGEHVEYGTLTKEAPPKNEVVADNNEESSKASRGRSIKTSNKLWKHAFDYGKCAVFNTGYADKAGNTIFIALFPFVYSEDGLDGKMYEFAGWDNYRRLLLLTVGDYEVHGDYIRIHNISQREGDGQRRNDKIYRIIEEDDVLRLEGRFLGNIYSLEKSDIVKMRQSSNPDVISLAEEILQRPSYNEHDI